MSVMYYEERVLFRIELAIRSHIEDAISIRFRLGWIKRVWRSMVLGINIQFKRNLLTDVVK